MPSYDTSISFVYKVETHKVSGKIVNVTGSEYYPLNGFVVNFSTKRTPSQETGEISESYTTSTASDGSYSFANVPSGAKGTITITNNDNTYQSASSGEISVSDADVTVGNISVEKFMRSVEGSLSLNTDKGTLKNATIVAKFEDDYWTYEDTKTVAEDVHTYDFKFENIHQGTSGIITIKQVGYKDIIKNVAKVNTDVDCGELTLDPITYYIQFKDSAGSTQMSYKQTVKYDNYPFNLNEKKFTEHPGYTFDNWIDVNGATYSDKQEINKNLCSNEGEVFVLTAQYTANNYKATVNIVDDLGNKVKDGDGQEVGPIVKNNLKIGDV